MLNPSAAEVVAGLHTWAEEHHEVIAEIWKSVAAPQGRWPRTDELTQHFFSRGRSLDVAALAGGMPHALGYLDQGRVVLTVRGAQYDRSSHPLLSRYVKAVALAVDRYRRGDLRAAVTRSDLARFQLAAPQVAQFERLLEGEKWALTKTGGKEGPPRYTLHPSAALALDSATTLGEYLEAQANSWWQSELDVVVARIPTPVTRVTKETAPAFSTDHAELRFDWLHPAIHASREPLMRAGHYHEAVLRAVNVLQEEIRTLARSKLDGAALMNVALSPKRPRISLAEKSSEDGRNIRSGTHHLALGLIAAVRNPSAHGLIDLSPAEALEQLALVSLIYRRLESARKRRDRRRKNC